MNKAEENLTQMEAGPPPDDPEDAVVPDPADPQPPPPAERVIVPAARTGQPKGHWRREPVEADREMGFCARRMLT